MKTYYEHEVIKNLNLNDTTLQYVEFSECKFENCEFENLKIIGCKFAECVFFKCRIANPVFENCSMSSNDFVKCFLLGINWSGLSSGFLPPIEHLQDCQIKYNNFVSSNYSKFIFTDNDILESMFADCNLSHSRFCRCHLNKTEFFRCDLMGASFEDADGYIVDISTCKLKGAAFSFPEVINLLGGLGIVIK